MDNVYLTASMWIGLALAASLISIRIGLSVALVEIFVGVLGGNFLHLQSTPWIDFLAGFGSVLLTFLAGAEIDPASFRRHLKPSLAIGAASFAAPFILAILFARFVVGWDIKAAEIAGVALSTTSVAVVYAVMVETGLNETSLGKLILAACFVTDLGTVLALGVLFANFDIRMVVFIAAVIPLLWLLPKISPWVISRLGKRVSEPEIKFVFLVLLFMGWLATSAKSEAVLPAYLIGLVTAGVFLKYREVLHRVRTIAFALLTPFFFIKAGALVSLPAVVAGLGLIAAFFAMKVGAKYAAVWPLSRVFRIRGRDGHYTTLLMSTGLTFGSISALYGLNNGIIDRSQYTVLVSVVIGSAILPTLVAQTWFRPKAKPEAEAATRVGAAGTVQLSRQPRAGKHGPALGPVAQLPVAEVKENDCQGTRIDLAEDRDMPTARQGNVTPYEGRDDFGQ